MTDAEFDCAIGPHHIDPADRARVRGLVQTVCSEVQPLNNLSVMQFLKGDMGLGDQDYGKWYAHWIERGFRAIETWLGDDQSGAFCHGDAPTLADCFLVPQVYNAERFECELAPYPRIRAITARCTRSSSVWAATWRSRRSFASPTSSRRVSRCSYPRPVWNIE